MTDNNTNAGDNGRGADPIARANSALAVAFLRKGQRHAITFVHPFDYTRLRMTLHGVTNPKEAIVVDLDRDRESVGGWEKRALAPNDVSASTTRLIAFWGASARHRACAQRAPCPFTSVPNVVKMCAAAQNASAFLRLGRRRTTPMIAIGCRVRVAALRGYTTS